MTKQLNEATVLINFNILTQAESATLRVALQSFASEISETQLGGDEHGKRMTEAYLQNISKILSYIFDNTKSN